MSKSAKKISKTALKAFGVAVALLVGSYVLLIILFNGGLENFIADIKPALNPTSVSMQGRRNGAKDSAESTFKKIEDATGLVAYRTTSHDICSRGDNNWKNNEGFANRCAYKITTFYGVSDRAAATNKLVKLNSCILSLGWDRTSVSYATEYTSNGARVSVENQSTTEPADYLLDINQKIYTRLNIPSYEKEDLVDAQSLLDAMAGQYSYVIMVSLEKVYFKN